MQDITKTDDVYHKPKFRKTYNFTQYLLPIFKRDIHEGYLLMIQKILLMRKISFLTN